MTNERDRASETPIDPPNVSGATHLQSGGTSDANGTETEATAEDRDGRTDVGHAEPLREDGDVGVRSRPAAANGLLRSDERVPAPLPTVPRSVGASEPAVPVSDTPSDPPTMCESRYTCGPECCNEELWRCTEPKGHAGLHRNVMEWTEEQALRRGEHAHAERGVSGEVSSPLPPRVPLLPDGQSVPRPPSEPAVPHPTVADVVAERGKDDEPRRESSMGVVPDGSGGGDSSGVGDGDEDRRSDLQVMADVLAVEEPMMEEPRQLSDVDIEDLQEWSFGQRAVKLINVLRAQLTTAQERIAEQEELLDAVPVIRGEAAEEFLANISRELSPEEKEAKRAFLDGCSALYEDTQRRIPGTPQHIIAGLNERIDTLQSELREKAAIISAIGHELDELRARACAADARRAAAEHRATRIVLDQELREQIAAKDAELADRREADMIRSLTIAAQSEEIEKLKKELADT